MDDKELVSKACKDIKYFAKLYEKYIDKIYSYVYNMVLNKTVAEDIVSETFEKAMLNIDKYEDRGYTFGAWLYTIARNLVYDNSKKSRNNFDIDEIKYKLKDNTNLDDDVVTSEQIVYLYEALEKLGEDQKEVMIMRYIEGFSIKETSDLLGKSEDSIKSLAKRGLKSIKEFIDIKYE